MALVGTDFSGESKAYIIMAKRIKELGTTLPVSNK
jgi:hypothetical protein